MLIFPAIDLSGGCVVRLYKGDYGHKKVYDRAPLATAKDFVNAGAQCLHVVDLDGAKEGSAKNAGVIEQLAQTGLFVQVGGGIRTMERIDAYINAGVSRVILGTAALRDPELLKAAVDKHGDKIAVGVDTRKGCIALSGWLEQTNINAFDFCKTLVHMGVNTVIYTDIDKDGVLTGTNLEAYRELNQIKGLNVIASGGISFKNEISELAAMNTYGAIIGKALYEGYIDLAEAIALGAKHDH